jgi:hypothetical protein
VGERPSDQLARAGSLGKAAHDAILLFDNSKPCTRACRGCCWRTLKGDARNIVPAPYGFADVNSSEIVEAKLEPFRQLFSFESKLNAKSKTRQIVNRAIVGLTLNQDPGGVVHPGARQSPFFHGRAPI